MLLNKIVQMLSLCVRCFVCFLVLMDLTSTKEVYGNPSSDFSRHSIVKPKLQHGRTKREIASTKDSAGTHHLEVTLTLSIDGEEHELELRLNEALVPSGHSLSYQQAGQTRVHTPGKEELDICQYSGRVRGRPGSWAAVSTCRGVRGVVYDGQRLRYIEPVDGNEVNEDHFLYSHEHLTKEYRCGNPDGPTYNSSYNQQPGQEVTRKRSRVNRYKRTAENPKVRTPSSANQRSRYVELVLVVDNGEFLANGGDLSAVHHQMKDLANIINSVYAPLNIFIALVGVDVWTNHDNIAIQKEADKTLKNFSLYRSTKLVKRMPHDNAHLLTRQSFTDGIVGRAYVGSMCSNKMSVGIASNHSRVIGIVAMTIAHEMGHNFGMHHDEGHCKCPDEKCIMSDTSNSVIPERWSSCSMQSLSLSFEKNLDHCLRNEPKTLFSSPTCGNGFLEEGEQCDCGTAPGEVSPGDTTTGCHACCNSDCTLRANATCGHGQCCDLATCRPKAIGTECRTADRECDLPEFCDGASPFCPQDVLKMDATPCGNEKAYCVGGACRSHTDQCRLLWGVTGNRSEDYCYDFNVNGNENGNCGYDRVTGYLPCAKEDVVCGRLSCSHLSKYLEYSNYETVTFSYNYPNINHKKIVPCHGVSIDMGISDEDPGMVPDGAICGPNKMCMRQRCLPVEQVREMVTPPGSVCPSNCSGHGVCNSNGNCHCESGYAPPLCEVPGAGGSYDSGPIVDTSELRRFMVAMYIIFLGIVPAIALVLLLIYCYRCHLLCWKNSNKQHYEKPRFGSKFALPNFNSFGKWLGNDTKLINCNNNSAKGQEMSVCDNSKPKDIVEHVYTEVGYDKALKNHANNTVTPTPSTKTNKKDMKEPTTFNRSLKDVVMVENSSHYTSNSIHKNPDNNLDVHFKPKVDAMRNKFESISGEKSNSISPNFKDLNKDLAVLHNDKSGSPINTPKPSSTTMPKPNLSPKPVENPNSSVSPKRDSKLGGSPTSGVSVCAHPKSDVNVSPRPKPNINAKLGVSSNPGISVGPKFGVSLKPSPGPKPSVNVNPKPSRLRENNPKPEIINAGLVSTTNEFLNQQRSKLRKAGDIKDVNK